MAAYHWNCAVCGAAQDRLTPSCIFCNAERDDSARRPSAQIIPFRIPDPRPDRLREPNPDPRPDGAA